MTDRSKFLRYRHSLLQIHTALLLFLLFLRIHFSSSLIMFHHCVCFAFVVWTRANTLEMASNAADTLTPTHKQIQSVFPVNWQTMVFSQVLNYLSHSSYVLQRIFHISLWSYIYIYWNIKMMWYLLRVSSICTQNIHETVESSVALLHIWLRLILCFE